MDNEKVPLTKTEFNEMVMETYSIADAEDFSEVAQAMTKLGFDTTEEEVKRIYKNLTAVMGEMYGPILDAVNNNGVGSFRSQRQIADFFVTSVLSDLMKDKSPIISAAMMLSNAEERSTLFFMGYIFMKILEREGIKLTEE